MASPQTTARTLARPWFQSAECRGVMSEASASSAAKNTAVGTSSMQNTRVRAEVAQGRSDGASVRYVPLPRRRPRRPLAHGGRSGPAAFFQSSQSSAICGSASRMGQTVMWLYIQYQRQGPLVHSQAALATSNAGPKSSTRKGEWSASEPRTLMCPSALPSAGDAWRPRERCAPRRAACDAVSAREQAACSRLDELVRQVGAGP